jgi:trk system potassium uptake protein TrkH
MNILGKILIRQKPSEFFTKNPGRTILFSFLFIILLGAMLLTTPYAAADGIRLSFLDSLFTSTSAVCVTGLIVQDTAVRFSFFGKIVIMLLIQAGGLGIMIMSYFASFIVGKKFTIKEKMTMSYLLNVKDMRKLTGSIVKIILTTFVIELIGVLFLYLDFSAIFGHGKKALFFSFFHAISAFCNAGFALFSDSFMQYRGDFSLNLIIALLIIFGGLSFGVIFNIFEVFSAKLKRRIRGEHKLTKLTINTRLVLIYTGILLFSGTIIIYFFEHKYLLLEKSLGTQYISAFFQSVTLRTAGFNTLDISKLQMNTILVMMVFMFIGGAAGSTAGGIKVNTFGVMVAYLRAMFRNRSKLVLMNHHIRKGTINKAFLIIFLGIAIIFSGTLILTITENFPLEKIMFEVVSAFGTVGLSMGITFYLSQIGKMVIIFTMFIGRVGLLTFILAMSDTGKTFDVQYPEGFINIG